MSPDDEPPPEGSHLPILGPQLWCRLIQVAFFAPAQPIGEAGPQDRWLSSDQLRCTAAIRRNQKTPLYACADERARILTNGGSEMTLILKYNEYRTQETIPSGIYIEFRF
jgi:hypothetical protein